MDEGEKARRRQIIETLIVKLGGEVRAVPVDDDGKPITGGRSEPVGYTSSGKPKEEEQKGKVVDTKS